MALAVALHWAPSAASDRDPPPPESPPPESPPPESLPPESLPPESLPPESLPATDQDTAAKRAERRVREGTEVVGESGYFRITGKRVSFFTDDGKEQYIVLENLNLERISRVISDNPNHLQWRVTGTVTEYRGSNFLFVRRAVLKTRLAPE